MTTLPSGNPRFPEDINKSDAHPLKEFLALLVAVVLGVAFVAVFIGLVSHWLAPFIPFQWEESLAHAADVAVDEEFGDFEFPGRQQQALRDIGVRLVQADQAAGGSLDRESEVPLQAFSFRLVHSDMANAFASFGARIYVTDALIDSVSSENALAMVLAHEIAHVQYRHPIRSAGSLLVMELTLSALLGGQGTSIFRRLLAGTGLVTMSGFSREMEQQSDERALATLVQAYGHSRGADEFFNNVVDEEDGWRWLEFTRTHPNTDRRLQVIKADIDAGLSDNATPHPLTPLPAALKFSVP
jgi:hypothetical protein